MTIEHATNGEYPHLEIHERCLRDTKGDQLWEAHAEHQGRVGPTVESYSRKSVRAKARTAFEHPTHVVGTVEVHEPDAMGFGWEDETIWLPRSLYPTRNDARKFYMEHTGVDFIEVSVLARWAVHDPQTHESEWWAECPKDTPGAFPVWRCE